MAEGRRNLAIPLTIAGIGASAGGVKALLDFFAALPAQVGAAIVVVIHLDPERQSELPRIIATRTKMPVEQVHDSAPLEADHVYVIPPNRRLLITDSDISAVEFDEPHGQRAPIDQFFRSLAEYGEGFAIILSGGGSDGALGVRAVKEAGGIILVQDPNEAEFDSMPRAVISAGHADFVLSLHQPRCAAQSHRHFSLCPAAPWLPVPRFIGVCGSPRWSFPNGRSRGAHFPEHGAIRQPPVPVSGSSVQSEIGGAGGRRAGGRSCANRRSAAAQGGIDRTGPAQCPRGRCLPDFEIVGKAGTYLIHPPGPPTLDITDLVRPELGAELRIMLNRAFQIGESGMSLAIPVQFNGHSRYVCLQVSPVTADGATHRALILFIEGGRAQMPVEPREMLETAGSEAVKRLQEELVATRANLKISRQQFETATENLRAANEELQSINEEYRSTAQELETSRKELQSMNEELQTLNFELKSKLDAVSRANNDLENLIIAADIGTLFLDSELRIKRFTPRIRELFKINSTDEGRQIGDLTNRLEYSGFEADARTVMKEQKVLKKTVRADKGWYLMQMRPYRTADGVINGVVATFVDTTAPDSSGGKSGAGMRGKK